MVMDYYVTQTLEEYIKSVPVVKPAILKSIAYQLLDVVAYIHSKGKYYIQKLILILIFQYISNPATSNIITSLL